MSFSHWITVAVVALMPLAATAQQSQPSQQSNPAEADVPVPAAGYVSAFEGYGSTPEEQVSPDRIWRAANEAVKSGDAHAGHGSMPATGAATDAPETGNPAVGAPEAGAERDPHAGHHARQGK
jgi:hypothetical protein